MRFLVFIKKHVYIIGLTLLFIAAIVLNELVPGHLAAIIVMSVLTVLAGFHIFKKAVMDLRYKMVGIDLLVSIAVIAAFIIGDYFEAAAVTYLFTLGHVLEKGSLEKTRSALKSLLELKPSKARVLQGNAELMVALDQVVIDDILLVKPGEKIPTDGVIIEGNSLVDEQMMTGESIPKEKGLDQRVYGSTLVTSGYLKVRATAVGEDTALSKIITMVEDAQDKKANTQKFIEKFARFYTPLIVLLAIVIYAVTLDIRLAITMLVISCPGALVIATPVSYVAGIGNAAKKGILFKGGDALERLTKADVVFFDKTGTLTRGKPELKSVITYDIAENESLRIAAIGESFSEHPLGQALIDAAKVRKLDLNEEATDVELIIGKGLNFKLNAHAYKIGNHKTLDFTLSDKVKDDIKSLEDQGMTTLIMSDETKVLALFALADTLRAEAKQLIAELKRIGVKKTIMLTGDEERVARAISEQLGLDGYHASLLPLDKAEIVKSYQKDHHVVFVGDGINDALALSYADASVAVGGLGKDLAMETSDIVLLGENIGSLSEAIKIARKVKANMYQNIILALTVVLVLIVGVIFKQVSMSLGMLVHEVSVLIVIINAIRLLAYNLGAKPWRKTTKRKVA